MLWHLCVCLCSTGPVRLSVSHTHWHTTAWNKLINITLSSQHLKCWQASLEHRFLQQRPKLLLFENPTEFFFFISPLSLYEQLSHSPSTRASRPVVWQVDPSVSQQINYVISHWVRPSLSFRMQITVKTKQGQTDGGVNSSAMRKKVHLFSHA